NKHGQGGCGLSDVSVGSTQQLGADSFTAKVGMDAAPRPLAIIAAEVRVGETDQLAFSADSDKRIRFGMALFECMAHFAHCVVKATLIKGGCGVEHIDQRGKIIPTEGTDRNRIHMVCTPGTFANGG